MPLLLMLAIRYATCAVDFATLILMLAAAAVLLCVYDAATSAITPLLRPCYAAALRHSCHADCHDFT